MPGDGGAYALVLKLDHPVWFQSRLVYGELPPGTYIYAGNANGPGGIRARLKRHSRSTKQVHWHIDQLTIKASYIGAVALPGADECDVVEWVRQQAGASFPLPGFGSSDCRRCRAHLLLIAQCPDWVQLPGANGANVTQLRPASQRADTQGG